MNIDYPSIGGFYTGFHLYHKLHISEMDNVFVYCVMLICVVFLIFIAIAAICRSRLESVNDVSEPGWPPRCIAQELRQRG